MDEHTSKTIGDIVEGVNGRNGHFILLALFSAFSFIAIALFSYIFLQACEQHQKNCATQNEKQETRLEYLDKTIESLSSTIETMRNRK
jgi:uncharacterized membrane protein